MIAAPIFTISEAAAKPTLVRHLETMHYKVTIREFCPNDFDCYHIEYQAISSSGKSIALHGSHLWHNCPGTNDPCHPVGYFFKNKGVSYTVSEDGELTVTQGQKVLLDEHGKWNDEK